MKQNIYFRQYYERRNLAKDFFLGFFESIASYPKLFLEVFLRKQFGDRYFNLASVLTVAAILAWLPTVLYPIADFTSGLKGIRIENFWDAYKTWYCFLALFLIMSFLRWRETRRSPSVFDFEQFSLSTGEIYPYFYRLPFKPSVRTIETLCEPALPFLLGAFFWLLKQPVGTLLMVCSVVYAFANMAAYRKGDDIIKSKIDEIIANEEMRNVFVLRLRASQTRGFQVKADLPNSPERREKLASALVTEERFNTVAL